jgi:ComF family protein
MRVQGTQRPRSLPGLHLGFTAPWQCLRALRPTLPVASSDITLCGACQRQPPAIDATIALYLYQHPIDHFIHQLKFYGRLAHAWLLGCLLTKHLAARLSLLPDCIVPAPPHPHQIRARGFNQTLELARQIGRRLQVPIDYRTTRRNRHADSQLKLPAKAPQKNIRGACKIADEYNARRVAILNDVVTTGATVNELARMLKKAGAECGEI